MNNEDFSRGEMVINMFFEFIRNPYQTPKQIMEKYGISKDKYHRYFTEISHVVPVSYNKKEKRFAFVSGKPLRGFMDSPEDFYAFLMAMQALGRGQTGKKTGTVASIEKMPGFGGDFDAITKFILFISPSDAAPQISTNLFLLNNALVSRRCVTFTYTKLGEKPYVINVKPYRIFFDQNWYLYGFAEERNATRVYRISRVSDIVLNSCSFEMPEFKDKEFKRIHIPWDFGDGPEIRVVLDFEDSVLGYLQENRFHKTEQYGEFKDGRFIYTVNVTSPLNMISWLMTFYGRVKVLEPQFLRDALIEKILEMNKVYEIK
ncbi:MAG: WYL domain-containing protein [Firmicutes bacterium]|nr:WYL domain-containing protein [Bacillota bacterium]